MSPSTKRKNDQNEKVVINTTNLLMLQCMKLGHKCTIISKNQENRSMFGGVLAQNASPTLIYRLPLFWNFFFVKNHNMFLS